MLTSASLSDDTFFTHPLGEECLTEGVVYFVCARMEQVLTLEINFSTATMFGQAIREIKIGRATCKLAKLVIELFLKRGVFARFVVGFGQFEKRCH